MSDTIDILRQKMEAAALALDFEEAKRCRDMIGMMRGGATPAEADRADFAGLERQQPGAMGLGTSQQRMTPPGGLAAAAQARSDDIGPLCARQAPQIVTAGARDMTLALLASRSPDATVCPSEVARAISPGAEWRDAMPTVHSVIDHLLDEGAVRLSWKGQPLARRDGPYRIGRVSRSQV